MPADDLLVFRWFRAVLPRVDSLVDLVADRGVPGLHLLPSRPSPGRSREPGMMGSSGKRLLAVALTVVVVAAVATGIVIIGSPMEERTRRLDNRRVQDLRQLSQAVQVYHARQQRTPASLDELSKEPGQL